jgi:ABC-type xylose transport system permease subunit
MHIKKKIPILFKAAEQSNFVSQIIILISFLFTFTIIRAVTHLQKAGILPNQPETYHIHHMVPGIILILIRGYIGISFGSSHTVRRMSAAFFGIGAALTIDEFALWLFLKDVYWEKQGRDSVDAVIITTVIIILSIIISYISMKAPGIKNDILTPECPI